MDSLKQRLFDLGYGTGSKTPSEASHRIEELEEGNKELTLQLLATSGQAADALDKLAKAVEAMKMAVKMWQKPDNEDPNIRMDNCINAIISIVPVLAELEGKE